MSEGISAEGTGDTVGEAKWAALRELERVAPGFDRASARLVVLAEGERGLLGVGYVPARVRAYAAGVPEASPPVAGEALPASEETELLSAFAARVVAALGIDAGVQVGEDGDEILLTITPRTHPGVVIGKHGQTIDAVQHLANALVYRTFGPSRRRVVVEADGYRARRAQALQATASRAAEQVSATGSSVELDPMNASERRIVHLHLAGEPEVTTSSVGEGADRRVVVSPRRMP